MMLIRPGSAVRNTTLVRHPHHSKQVRQQPQPSAHARLSHGFQCSQLISHQLRISAGVQHTCSLRLVHAAASSDAASETNSEPAPKPHGGDVVPNSQHLNTSQARGTDGADNDASITAQYHVQPETLEPALDSINSGHCSDSDAADIDVVSEASEKLATFLRQMHKQYGCDVFVELAKQLRDLDSSSLVLSASACRDCENALLRDALTAAEDDVQNSQQLLSITAQFLRQTQGDLQETAIRLHANNNYMQQSAEQLSDASIQLEDLAHYFRVIQEDLELEEDELRAVVASLENWRIETFVKADKRMSNGDMHADHATSLENVPSPTEHSAIDAQQQMRNEQLVAQLEGLQEQEQQQASELVADDSQQLHSFSVQAVKGTQQQGYGKMLVKALQKQAAETMQQRERDAAYIAQLERDLSSKTDRLAATDSKLADMEAQLSEKTAKLAEKEVHYVATKEQLDEMTDWYMATGNKIADTEAQLSVKTTQLEAKEEQYVALNQQLLALKAQLAAIQSSPKSPDTSEKYEVLQDQLNQVCFDGMCYDVELGGWAYTWQLGSWKDSLSDFKAEKLSENFLLAGCNWYLRASSKNVANGKGSALCMDLVLFELPPSIGMVTAYYKLQVINHEGVVLGSKAFRRKFDEGDNWGSDNLVRFPAEDDESFNKPLTLRVLITKIRFYGYD